MIDDALLKLKFPIGKYKRMEGTLPHNLRNDYITIIKEAPLLFKKAVEGLNDQQLDTPYRPGGWTLRQLVHHMADSHLNSFVRFKWALTEENPVIKVYDEKSWAETPEVFSVPIAVSLQLLDSLHQRWAALLEALSTEDCMRTFQHPVSGSMTLDQAIGLYSWHCKHHLAHILGLKERENWQ